MVAGLPGSMMKLAEPNCAACPSELLAYVVRQGWRYWRNSRQDGEDPVQRTVAWLVKVPRWQPDVELSRLAE